MPVPGSNCLPTDLQSDTLPTELYPFTVLLEISVWSGLSYLLISLTLQDNKLLSLNGAKTTNVLNLAITDM